MKLGISLKDLVEIQKEILCKQPSVSLEKAKKQVKF